jgi:signal transduction histidine kinase
LAGRPDKRERPKKRQRHQGILKKKNTLLFFYLPVLGFVVIFFVFSSMNRRYITKKFEGLVEEQLKATAEILKVNFSHFLSEGTSSEKIFELYSGEENIYYMALLDEDRQILGWKSRFEGYLPISKESMRNQGSWIINSPAGKIFNSFSSFSLPEGRIYYLYLGYSLVDLQEMMARSRRNFYLVFTLIVAVGVVFAIGLYQLQVHYIDKKRELEEEKKEKEHYREVSALTSGVAHEIKNPLNSLGLLFELLIKKNISLDPEAITSGKKEVEKISRIVDQFSSSLKPIELRRERFDLEEEIQSVRKDLVEMASVKGVDIRYSQDLPIAVFADRGLLHQAIYNLVKNAVEASDNGIVAVTGNQEKKKVIVSVTDSGMGLDEEAKKRVFEPFYSQKKDGMGIGLYLTKKIVEAHGGAVDVESKAHESTTFTIVIPGD